MVNDSTIKPGQRSTCRTSFQGKRMRPGSYGGAAAPPHPSVVGRTCAPSRSPAKAGWSADYFRERAQRCSRLRRPKPLNRSSRRKEAPFSGRQERVSLLRAGLKMERGCVEDQPQHGANTPRHRNWGTCCRWSRTTQSRFGVFRPAPTSAATRLIGDDGRQSRQLLRLSVLGLGSAFGLRLSTFL